MKLFQVIIFASTLSFASCGSDASSYVDVEQVTVSEDVILENNLIDAAIKIVEGEGPSNPSPPPMQGIQTLLQYADADSPSVKANFWLGKFGVQSQQLEKAKARFLKVLEIDPEHKEALINLFNLYVKMEDFNAASELYRKHPYLKSDSLLTKDLEESINRLESDISVVSGPNE
jgi:tetratricopeptide (TPR) repeat protein